MKSRILTLMSVICFLSLHGQTILYTDNFSGYSLNSYIGIQNPTWWTTWSNAPGTPEDAKVSNTFSHTATKSIRADEVGGSTDLILKLGNKTYGAYEIKWWMYIEYGKMAYYNVQHFQTPGIEFAYDVYFMPGGMGEMYAGNVSYPFSFSNGAWFEVRQIIDLGADQARLYVQGVLVNQWPFHYRVNNTNGTNQLGCVDFYAGGTNGITAKFYIDDVTFAQIGTAADPHITVNPASIITSAAPGASSVNVLTIGNTGGSPLNFSSNTLILTDASAVLNYDGNNANAFGFSAIPTTATVAARFPNSLTLPKAGMELVSVDVCINQLNPIDTNLMTLKVFGMGTAGEPGMLLRSQQFTPLVPGWLNIPLNDPLTLTGEDIWIGYTFTQYTANIKIPGTDAGPANTNGDLYNSGAGWVHLNANASQSRNWNIRGHVTGDPVATWLSATPSSGTVAPNGNQIVNVSCNTDTLPLGTYNGILRILSNDPTHPTVDVPVTMIVAFPSCPAPQNIEVEDVTSTGAKVTWTNAPIVQLDYGPAGHAPGTGTFISPVNSSPYYLTGLSPLTTYDIYIQRACDFGVTSTWQGPFTITTADVYTVNLEPYTVPFATGNISNGTFIRRQPAQNVSASLNDTIGRGFVKFNLGPLPPNAVITKATMKYFLEEQTSGAIPAGRLHLLSHDPVVTTGALLHTDCADESPVWTGTWNVQNQGWITSPLSEKGIGYLKEQINRGWAGFGVVTAGTSLSRFSGYDNTLKKQKLVVEYHLLSTPVCEITPSSADFRQVNTGMPSLPESFMVRNQGSGQLTISSISVEGNDAGDFSSEATVLLPKTLNAGETFYVNVTFLPDSPGQKSASLKITENNGTIHSVALTGEGYLSAPGNVVATPVYGPDVTLVWQTPLPEGEIRIDNGTVSAWTGPSPSVSQNYMLFKRITMPDSGIVHHINLLSKNTGTLQAFESIMICPDLGGIPDISSPLRTFPNPVALTSSGAWLTLALSDTLHVSEGENLFIVVKYLQGNLAGPLIGADTTLNLYRSAFSFNNGLTWEYSGMEIMARAYLSCSSFPVNALVDYTVERGTSPGIFNVTFPGISSNAFTDTTTLPVTQYFYRIKANYLTGSMISDATSVTTFETCPVPSALTASNPSTTQVTLSWNSNGTLHWQLEYGPAGFARGTGTFVYNVNQNPFTINGLQYGTTYDFYLRSDCGSEYSSWTGPSTFTTLCPLFSTPFNETFDVGEFPPQCWNRQEGNNSWEHTHDASAYGIGDACAMAAFYNFSQPTPFYISTIEFDATPLAAPALVFDFAYATYLGAVDTLDVEYSMDGGETWLPGITMIGGETGLLNTGGSWSSSFIPSPAQWKTMSLGIPPQTNKIRFKAISAYGNNLYLDNIRILQPDVPCMPPTLLTAGYINDTSATLTWNGNPAAVAWDVEYRPLGMVPGSGIRITGLTSSTCTLTGLAASTTYVFTVRQACTATDYSNWSAEHLFTTTGGVPVNQTVSGTLNFNQSQCYNASQVLTVGGISSPFAVQQGASATLIAGQRITILPGTQVMNGGYFHAYIAMAGPWCNTSAAPVQTVAGFTTISDDQKPEFSIHPNPTSSFLTVTLKNGQPIPDGALLQIFDMRGVKMFEEDLSHGPAHRADCRSLPAGVYLVRILTGDRYEMLRMVKVAL